MAFGRRAGFTLIEVLVVVVVLAVLAGALAIAMPGFDQRRAEREADRFAAMLALACEQAELAGRELGVHLGAAGYGFSLADLDGWLPFGNGHRFHEHVLEGVELALPDAELPPVPDYERAPQASCWPTGELSALDVRFVHGERVFARVRAGADALPLLELAGDDGAWRER